MSKNLTKKSIKAGSWLVSYNASARIMGIVKTAIIARILTPADFGVFGVIAISLSLLETFSETSIFQALIQKDKVTEKELSTAWIISIIRGLIVSLVLVASTPIIEVFFKQDNLLLYITVMALAPLIRNFRNPATVFFQKDLDFKKEFKLRFFSSLTELIVGIYVAFITKSIWGLIAANITGAIAEVISSFVLIKFPSWEKPSFKTAKSLFNYGRWLWGSSILYFIATQGDDAVVGRILGNTSLGLYQNAYKIASLPATQITSVVSQVGFPAMSKIKSDPVRIKRAFKKTFYFNFTITIISSILLYIFAFPIVQILLGNQWLGMIPALRVLIIFGALRSFSTTTAPLLKALNMPKEITIYGVLRILFMAITIIPLTKMYGIIGTSWSTVISVILSLPYLIIKTKKALS